MLSFRHESDVGESEVRNVESLRVGVFFIQHFHQISCGLQKVNLSAVTYCNTDFFNITRVIEVNNAQCQGDVISERIQCECLNVGH